MVLAFLGIFGGQPHPTISVADPSATIMLQVPQRIRNGEFFEMRMEIKTKRRFEDLTLTVSSSYWHDLTVNTMIPAPAEEKSENGRFLFSYGKIDAGTALTVKIDGQINPPLFLGNAGDIQLRDGDTTIVTIPVEMKVMP